MSVLNSKCALHYEFNLSFLILSPPSPSPLGEAEALDCCCGKLGPNTYDALLLLVFSKIQLQHFRRTHLGINSTRNVGRVLYFPRFDISLNDLHIKRPGSWFVSVTDVLVISDSDLEDSPLPGLRIIFILQFPIILQF